MKGRSLFHVPEGLPRRPRLRSNQVTRAPGPSFSHGRGSTLDIPKPSINSWPIPRRTSCASCRRQESSRKTLLYLYLYVFWRTSARDPSSTSSSSSSSTISFDVAVFFFKVFCKKNFRPRILIREDSNDILSLLFSFSYRFRWWKFFVARFTLFSFILIKLQKNLLNFYNSVYKQ